MSDTRTHRDILRAAIHGWRSLERIKGVDDVEVEILIDAITPALTEIVERDIVPYILKHGKSPLHRDANAT